MCSLSRLGLGERVLLGSILPAGFDVSSISMADCPAHPPSNEEDPACANKIGVSTALLMHGLLR
jgi:hypothetical protein